MSTLSILILGWQGKLHDAKDLRRYENAVLNVKAASATAAVVAALIALLY